MNIEEHIDEIRADWQEDQFPDEAAVSKDIVLMLLGNLGWPKHKPRVIISQYPVESGKVDFALCHPESQPRVFVKTKKVGNLEGANEQLFSYALHNGVPLVVLTDGQRWIFYQPTGVDDSNERKVYEIDFIQDESVECARCLRRYLSYQAIKGDYGSFMKLRELPKAWNKLIEEENERLIEIVAEKTESLCRYRPTDEQVLGFLESTKKEPPPPKTSGHSSKSKRKRTTHLLVTMPNGQIINYTFSSDTFVAVIEKLSLERVKRLEIEMYGIPLISTYRDPVYNQPQSGSYYIMTTSTTEKKKELLDEIAEQLGVDLKVEIVDK